jgi:hypothetical protein
MVLPVLLAGGLGEDKGYIARTHELFKSPSFWPIYESGVVARVQVKVSWFVYGRAAEDALTIRFSKYFLIVRFSKYFLSRTQRVLC